jgi:hypothetical protein
LIGNDEKVSKRDVAQFHSISSSAVASNTGGADRPSAWAVLRLSARCLLGESESRFHQVLDSRLPGRRPRTTLRVRGTVFQMPTSDITGAAIVASASIIRCRPATSGLWGEAAQVQTRPALQLVTQTRHLMHSRPRQRRRVAPAPPLAGP